MAKRKRLGPANLTAMGSPEEPPALETKSAFNTPSGRAPVAQVASDTATHAALDKLAAEVSDARATGRMVVELAHYDIEVDHLVRDRIHVDPDELAALKASILARGQQTPVEVMDLGEGVYGLISGWRRLKALKELFHETGQVEFATVLAVVKPMESVADSYVAMVEENEIRADLSFYERARLACEAARLDVYPDSATAVRKLFASGSRARRSKINTFVRLYEALGQDLTFPTHIPERLGLSLVKAIEADPGVAKRISRALSAKTFESYDDERKVLEAALKKAAAAASEPVTGVQVRRKGQTLTLTGPDVTIELEQALREWLQNR